MGNSVPVALKIRSHVALFLAARTAGAFRAFRGVFGKTLRLAAFRYFPKASQFDTPFQARGYNKPYLLLYRPTLMK
jgi:hypothetical protein